MQMLALNIQKLPGGGYMLAYTTENGEPLQAYAASSTLPEVFQRLVLPLARDHFREEPILFASPTAHHQAPLPPIGDDGTLPRVATGPARHGVQTNSSLQAALDGVRAGSVNIITPLLIAAAMWVGSRTWGLV